jgi:3-keto-L-gulonate-6-phosphate decarboxylase
MSRFVIAEQGHSVPIIYPQGSGAATINSDIVSLKNASHCSIILMVGVQAGAFTAKVYAGADFSTCAQAFDCAVYKEETTISDMLGARTAVVGATGVATAATNYIFYVFEIDAEDLPDGYPNIQLQLSDLDNTTYVAAVAILSGYAYQGTDQVTEIA